MKATEFCLQEQTSSWYSSRRSRFAALLIAILIIVMAGQDAFAAEQIYQSGYAMYDFNPAAYQVVQNANTTLGGYGYAYTSSQSFDSTSGPEMKFRSLIYTDIPNPQSICINPEGTVAWVLSSYKTANDNARHGRVYRVDLKKYWGKKAKGDKKNSKAVKAGPEIVTGHGQTIGFNPVTRELWFVRETKGKSTTFVQVDPKTLEIKKEIHTAFGRRGTVPPTFCFDREGYFWMYTRSAGTNYAPAGTIRFVKGYIEDDHVYCWQIGQGLRYPPGTECQGLGYNPYNDKLYVSSNGETLVVPATKLSNEQITASDVEVIKFMGSTKREFEGLTFSEDGTAFFMTNKPCEIMRDNVSYKIGLKERERIKKVKKQYKIDKKAIKEQSKAERDVIVTDEISRSLDAGI